MAGAELRSNGWKHRNRHRKFITRHINTTKRCAQVFVAIRLERMLQTGEVSDLTELARLGHVTQPRMSQILNLTLLAPDIQEALLFLPRVESGKPPVHEKMLRPILAEVDWGKQREMWSALLNAGSC